MALRLILGNSGSGKSTYLGQTIIEEAKNNPDVRYLVIVPEQYTLRTQQRYALCSESGVILNVDVLSFKRLAHRIFEELGVEGDRTLDDLGKSLILRQITSENMDNFSVLKGDIRRPGYIDEIKSLITELVQYSVTPEALMVLADREGIPGLLQKKIKDVCLIYKSFIEDVSGKYMLDEELLVRLSQMVDKTRFFDNTVLVFDGYTGFTPVQQVFLNSVFGKVRDIYVALTIDNRDSITGDIQLQDLFYLTKKCIKALYTMAENNGVDICEPVMLGGDTMPRFVGSDGLAHLEKNIFRDRTDKFRGDNSDIVIAALGDVSSELEYTAALIRQLVDTEGYRYRDIAVVSGDVETYSHYVDHILGRYHIPYFLDMNRPILYQPLLECVRGMVDLGVDGLTYETVMRILKTGLIPADEGIIDEFENYILAFGITGNKFGKKFTRIPRWLAKEDSVGLEELDEFRAKLSLVLMPLAKTLTNKTSATEKSKALWAALDQLAVIPEETDSDKKILASIVEVFEKLHAIVGEEIMSGEEYKELVDTGLADIEQVFVPMYVDTVTIGDIERTRLENIKVLIFNGVNDGIIPASDVGAGILSDMDREWVLGCQDVELAPTKKERAFIQRFYLYNCVTRPSDKLYITYHAVASDGKSVRPSYLISTLKNLYPGLEVMDPKRIGIDRIVTADSAIDLIASEIEAFKNGDASDDLVALFKWYQTHDEYKDRIDKILKGAFLRLSRENIAAHLMDYLFEDNTLELSASSIKKYNSCQYSFFIERALRIRERDTYEFSASDLGNLLHSCLELFGARLIADEKKWGTLTAEEKKEYTREVYEDALLTMTNDSLLATAKSRFMEKNVRHELALAVDMLANQAAAGGFELAGVEKRFGKKLDSELSGELEGGRRYTTIGSIDRMDIAARDDKKWLSVIDYKTGSTSFSLANIYYGLELQLPIYMIAAKAMIGDDSKPAGMFYYKAKDFMHEDSELSNLIAAGDTLGATERLKKLNAKATRLDGIVSGDEGVLDLYDSNLSAGEESLVIPAKLKKDGNPDSNSKVYSSSAIEKLCKYVVDIIAETADDISNGKFAINPYEKGQMTSCTYCKYRSICRFDESVEGYSFRYISDSEGKSLMEEKMGLTEE